MSNESPSSLGQSPDEGSSDRLDSWKDIAADLKRDVSTVQRWEKREAMPVHRHLHDKLGTVYAFRSELDVWWRGRGLHLARQEPPGLATVSAPVSEHGKQGGTAAPVPLDQPGHANPKSTSWPRRRLALAGAVAISVLAVIGFGLRLDRTSEGTGLAIKSLAVLPLDSLSDDPAQEYLADGLTDALISELGRIGSLRVIARGSVMKYKGAHPAASDVGRELGVQGVVSGSVVRSGDRIRITVNLIDAASDRRLWSDTIERDVAGVLTLQREVTAAIAGHMQATLPPTRQARLDTRRPVNPAAYDAVLRARYLSVRTTDADNGAAIALLERAIELDPGFAPAHAELAKARVTRLAYVTPEGTGELEEKAFSSAEKALSLDPDLPEAYLARGDLLWSHSHKFAHERAVQEFRRALALNPNSDHAHQRLARVYVHVGFFEEALQHAAIALSINPSNAQALNSRAQATLWMGKDEEALAILLSIPGPVLPELVEANTAFALFRLGRSGEAWTHLEKAARKYPNDASGNLPAMQALLFAESDPGKADKLLVNVAGRKPVNPAHHAAYVAAAASARMGHAERAVQWLREAVETGFPCYPLFARDPNLDPIRQDPQFLAFMAEMQKRSMSLRKALQLSPFQPSPL